MYYTHFGLVHPPFRITPDTSLFFSGAERGSMLDALTYVVLSGEGITKVIGEVGSGKTMLCRMLEEKLPPHVETIYIANPNIAPENIPNVLAFEAGFESQPEGRLELMHVLQDWLLTLHANNRRVVVLIEEAQGMPVETLEEVRLLSNLETGQDKLLQIVLFGQPELDKKLAQPQIRQLQDRIAHNFYLSPLTGDEIRDYANFRVRQAGYHGPDLFDEPVARAIKRASHGLIRRINIIADKTLLAAYSEGTTRLSPKHVRTAAKDSRFTEADRFAPWLPWLAGGGGIAAGLLLAAMAAWIWWPAATPSREGADQPARTAGVERQATEAAVADSDAPEQPAAAPTDPAADSEIRDNPARRNLVQTRLADTRQWLENARDSQYSIQVMTFKAASLPNLNDYLKELPKTIDLNDIFVYETQIGGNPMIGVLYRRFDSRAAAQAQMRDMPGPFKDIEPFLLRSVRGLRNEITDRNS